MEDNTITIAIQLLPLVGTDKIFTIIDSAIEIIAESNLPYKVCAFETVVEGKFDELMRLVEKIKNNCLSEQCSDIIINLKIHAATRNLKNEFLA